jgi:SPP1 family predicted phage head-tail adaptor
VNAGRLDRLIRFQEAVSSQDDSGQEIPVWTPLGLAWAQVTPLRGGESYGSAQQVVADADTKFKIRWPEDFSVTPRETLRILYDGRVYDVKEVIELGRREGLDILAKTRPE